MALRIAIVDRYFLCLRVGLYMYGATLTLAVLTQATVHTRTLTLYIYIYIYTHTHTHRHTYRQYYRYIGKLNALQQ